MSTINKDKKVTNRERKNQTKKRQNKCGTDLHIRYKSETLTKNLPPFPKIMQNLKHLFYEIGNLLLMTKKNEQILK